MITEELLDNLNKIEKLYKIEWEPPTIFSRREIDLLGDIKSIRTIKSVCVNCGSRADFEIRRSNDGLPRPYIQEGVRIISYCESCLPEDGKRVWDNWTEF